MSTQKKIKLDGGEFILKDIPSNEVFTAEDFSEEQKMIRDTVIEFIDREIWPHKKRFEENDYDFTVESMKKIGELGLLGINVDQDYGGLGMDFVSTMLVCDYISGSSGSLATAYGAHTGIAILPIYLYGNEEQKKRFLPDILNFASSMADGDSSIDTTFLTYFANKIENVPTPAKASTKISLPLNPTRLRINSANRSA